MADEHALKATISTASFRAILAAHSEVSRRFDFKEYQGDSKTGSKQSLMTPANSVTQRRQAIKTQIWRDFSFSINQKSIIVTGGH